MKIFSESSRNSRKGAKEWFTGNVWLDEIMIGTAPSKLRAYNVTFEPGARTAWHTHPVGQTLHVVSGVGLVQCKGEAVQQIRSGDSVWIDPNELHWHGAAPGHTMVHLAMHETDDHGVEVVWSDLVTDEEYSTSP